MLETGRYENFALNDMVCPICKSERETKIRVLTHCPTYKAVRNVLYNQARNINETFVNIDEEKFVLYSPILILLNIQPKPVTILYGFVLVHYIGK